jgi:hypothetical protein
MLLMITQAAVSLVVPKIAQTTVLAILIAATLAVLGLLSLIGIFAWRTQQALVYGNFFVVVLGILSALIGFLVAFPLLVSGVFKDPTQVLALLSALFGTIVGLVGTFFGVKTSSDARDDLHKVATSALGGSMTEQLVSLTDPPDRADDVPTDTRVTATFSSDMDPATINTATFKLLKQEGLAPVVGRVEYDVQNRRATFIPDAHLESGKLYGATITASVKDQAGKTLAEDHSWHFKVEDQGV